MSEPQAFVDRIPVIDLHKKKQHQIANLWPNSAAVDTWITSNPDYLIIPVVNAWGQVTQFMSEIEQVHPSSDDSDTLLYKVADAESRAICRIRYYETFCVVACYTKQRDIETVRAAYDEPEFFDNVASAINYCLSCCYLSNLFDQFRHAIPKGVIDAIELGFKARNIVGRVTVRVEEILEEFKGLMLQLKKFEDEDGEREGPWDSDEPPQI